MASLLDANTRDNLINKEGININNIRKLALKQPYADLVVNCNKIETRTWYTQYRGWVLITSSKQSYKENIVKLISGEKQYNRIQNELNRLTSEALSYSRCLTGVALGIGKLIDCRPMQLMDENKCFVDYHSDLFCHTYEKFYPIVPFQIKNSMKWGKLTESEFNSIQLIANYYE